jgi:hypothetical protein
MIWLRAICILGCLCAILGGQTSVRASSPDPFAGDERMAAKRTIRVHDKPMPDFLADLNLQTGIRFFADKSVADDKVTVYAHDRPLGDTLRVIAAFFKFEWKRDGAAKDFGYILLQSPEYQAEQDRIRREKTAEAADTILAEVEAFDRYMRLSEGQLQARQSSIAKDLLEVSDPSHKKALLMENNVLAQLIARSDWRTRQQVPQDA